MNLSKHQKRTYIIFLAVLICVLLYAAVCFIFSFSKKQLFKKTVRHLSPVKPQDNGQIFTKTLENNDLVVHFFMTEAGIRAYSYKKSWIFPGRYQKWITGAYSKADGPLYSEFNGYGYQTVLISGKTTALTDKTVTVTWREQGISMISQENVIIQGDYFFFVYHEKRSEKATVSMSTQ